MMFPAHPASARPHATARPGFPRDARGFTLTELLVTVTLVGVVSAIGFPILSSFVEDAAVSTQADVVLDSLMFTRSEAVKRNTRVTMCRSVTGAACGGASVGDWRLGWIIYTDSDTVGTVGTLDSTDTVIRVQAAFSGKGKVIGTGDVIDYVSYASTGQTRFGNAGAQSGTFSLCGNSTKTKRRQIALTPGTGWVGAKIVAAAPNCTDA